MPHRYRQRILDHLSNQKYQPVDADTLARQLKIGIDDLDDFGDELGDLIDEELVEFGRNERIQLPPLPSEIEGTIKITSRGFGFVVPDTPYREGDLFIAAKETMDAISGDRVRAAVMRKGRPTGRGSGRLEVKTSGRVLEVIERRKTAFTGSMHRQRGSWFMIPDGRTIREPILVRDADSRNIKTGDKVVLEIIHYPDGRSVAEGVITEVLGEAGRPDVETRAVIADFGLATDFPEAVVDEARKSAKRFDESEEGPWDDRLDLTDTLTFTIDPPDARDFDDAISIQFDPRTNEYELGVHIADVASFVTAGGGLDKEASKRGNSTYLPRRVLPMLPELLSNGVCSLQEGVIRFVKSAFIRYDGRGRVVGNRFHRAVIRSRRRLTYLEAQALIDGDQTEARRHAKTTPDYPEELLEALAHANTLARAIQKERYKAGMLRLDLPESVLVFDEEGHVVDAEPEDDAFTHTIIEMFMVAANEAVASLFSGLETPLLRRMHPEPDLTHIDELRELARLVRFQLPQEPERSDLQPLIDISRGTPYERAIHFAILRTFTKASYGPARIGHFALASEHYAHFTSPIRRYPDLTVHRVFEAFLDLTDNGRNIPGGKKRRKLTDGLSYDERCLSDARLTEIGAHCSETEVNSAEAERSLRAFMVLRFLDEQEPGTTFPGIVTGTTTNGALYVMLDRFLADGMVEPGGMPGLRENGREWNLDRMTRRLHASKSGASIGIGDRVEVQILSINLHAREMTLSIVDYTPGVSPAIGENPNRERSERRSGGRRKGREGGKRKGYKMGRRGKRSR